MELPRWPCAWRVSLGRLEVTDLHQRYLEALAVIAWEDGVVTDAEHDDLAHVAGLLGLGTTELDRALTSAASSGCAVVSRYGRFGLIPGDVIVLTGTFSQPKEVLEAQAAAVGLIPAGSLTKKTRLLVAADVDTMSGKADKARKYGIPIVGEPALLRLIAECGTARGPGSPVVS